MEQPTDRLGSRIAGPVIGALVGGVAGLIVAVNLVIYLGPDEGYQSSIGAVFDHNMVLGLVTIAVVVAGPLTGIVMGLRLGRQGSRAGRS